MEFRILGPLEVLADGRALDLGGPKQRALLGALLLAANRAVSSDDLVRALWDDEPPGTAQKALQIHVSNLRKLLGRERVETRVPGYLLRVAEGELDLQRFEGLEAKGRHAEALALWRGPPLADLADRAFAQADIARLEELRLSCLEGRLEQEIESGREREVIPELEALVRDYPLRQRLRLQLMLALYRSGRHAEALAAYQEARTQLVDELGIEPARELRQLQQQILQQDPALDSGRLHEQLPSGTVTFLFSDIEASTARLDAIGAEAYALELQRQRAILRDAFGRHGGVEVDTQGDALFAAFPTAPGAIAAAVRAQEVLAGQPVRVRMGIHTGTPLVMDTGYAGLDVHRGARIAAAAHGGQIVVSSATAALLDDAGLLRDLGRHRLKDVPDAEHLYQVGDADFPPLRSLHRTNLPVAATAFLGRGRELAEIVDLIGRDEVKLLTLTGPGGTGKTRLALRAAERLSDSLPGGTWWIPLATVGDPKLVLPTIASALEVSPRPGEPLADTLSAAFAQQPAAVVLDSAEHLVPGIAHELASLESLGQTTVIVTSRERLHLAEEHVYLVQSMTPRDAVDLFLARTAQQGVSVADEAVVEQLCARLDHLPLAIELAAARASLFNPEQLLERVGARLDLFRGGHDADPRQRTLRATMEWSYDLLDDQERRLLRSLAVFVGGCSYDAAESVCGADPDTLQSLIEKSLLRRRDGGEPRYWMLETVREYARTKLDEDVDRDDLGRRHMTYYLAFCEQAGHEIAGAGAGHSDWLARLDGEIANVRVMLQRLSLDGGDEERGLVAAALWRYWVSRDLAEGLGWLEQAAALQLSDETRVRVLHGLAAIAIRLGRLDVAEAAARERVELHARLGDELGSAESRVLLGNVAAVLDDLAPDARDALEAAVSFARNANETAILAGALSTLGYVALRGGDATEALAHSLEAARLWEELHRDDQLVVALINAASALVGQGELERARATLRRSLRLALTLGDRDHIAYCLDGYAAADAAADELLRAAVLLDAADALRAETGTPREPYEQRVNERTRAIVAAGLGDDQGDTPAGSGTLSPDEAVALVLEERVPITHDLR
jgi:predicted ATPase/DNA-binding SARP family transcriptional activator